MNVLVSHARKMLSDAAFLANFCRTQAYAVVCHNKQGMLISQVISRVYQCDTSCHFGIAFTVCPRLPLLSSAASKDLGSLNAYMASLLSGRPVVFLSLS
jgi:hypothetical protein